MKKLLKNSFIALTCLITICLSVCLIAKQDVSTALADEYSVAGWAETIDFENASDINKLNIGGDKNTKSFISSGRLCIPVWDFQFGAIKTKSYSGDIDVRTHVYAAGPTTALAFGLEVRSTDQSTSGVSFFISRAVNTTTATAKIGAVAADRGTTYYASSASIPLGAEFDMRVVLKGTMAYVFINDFNTPVVSYDVGGFCRSSGYVGFRGWQAAMSVEYITIIAPENSKTTGHTTLLNQAKAVDKNSLTTTSSARLTSAISAVENATGQDNLNLAVNQLKVAMDALVYNRTVNQLNALIQQASAIQNPNGSVYTANSYNSMTIVLENCRKVDTTDAEQVSYWATALEQKIESLIPYVGGAN